MLQFQKDGALNGIPFGILEVAFPEKAIWQEDAFQAMVGEHNLAVEHSITNHLLAEDADMDAEMYRKYRGYSVREVTDTQGAFSFRDALRLHRRQ